MVSRGSTSTLALSVLFVPLWASGFVGGKIATTHSDVAPVLFWRFAIAATVMGVAAGLAGARLPRGREWAHLAVVSLLLQVGQFACVYTGLAHGIPAGLSSLIMAMAPLFVSLLAPMWFPERLTPGTVLGLLLGALGVYIVLSGDLQALGSPLALGLTLVGMGCLTAGTLYQKKHGARLDVRMSVTAQMSISAAVIAMSQPFTHATWLPRSAVGWEAIVWLGIVNSAGAFAVMYLLLQRVSTVHVSSLLNLVPAVTALASVPILGEHLSLRYLIGMAVALIGMYTGIAAAKRLARSSERRQLSSARADDRPDSRTVRR